MQSLLETHPLRKILESRIAIIDGAMGTTIRTYGMTEADIRADRFKSSTKDLLNNGDLFTLTQPEMICDIHRRFLEAGADIIETNTFGATRSPRANSSWTIRVSTAAERIPISTKRSSMTPSSTVWPGRSMSNRPVSAASGPIASRMKPAGSALWPGQSAP
jgi:methionine synthase I (cobalamin-dependent)